MSYWLLPYNMDIGFWVKISYKFTKLVCLFYELNFCGWSQQYCRKLIEKSSFGSDREENFDNERKMHHSLFKTSLYINFPILGKKKLLLYIQAKLIPFISMYSV